MIYRRRLITVGLVALLCSISLSVAAAQRNLRITAEGWYYPKYKIQEAAERFMKNHPDVKVTCDKIEMMDIAAYMLRWSRGKTDVDLLISRTPAELAAFVAKDLLVDFEDIFTGEFSKDNWVSGFLDACTIKGKIYGLGTDCAVFTLIAREDWMKEAGLADSEGKAIAPKNLDELYDYTRKLTRKDGTGKTVRYGLEARWHEVTVLQTYISGIQPLRGNIFEPDGTTVDFSSKEAHEWLDFWYKGVKDGYMSNACVVDHNAPRSHMKSGITSMIWVDQARFNECGKVLGFDKLTILPVPGAEKYGTAGYAMTMEIPRVSPNVDLAKQFIKEEMCAPWFAQWTWENYGKMMSYKPAYEGLKFKPDLLQSLMAVAEKSVHFPLYKEFAKVKDLAAREISAMLTLEQVPEKTLQNIREGLRQIDLTIVQ